MHYQLFLVIKPNRFIRSVTLWHRLGSWSGDPACLLASSLWCAEAGTVRLRITFLFSCKVTITLSASSTAAVRAMVRAESFTNSPPLPGTGCRAAMLMRRGLLSHVRDGQRPHARRGREFRYQADPHDLQPGLHCIPPCECAHLCRTIRRLTRQPPVTAISPSGHPTNRPCHTTSIGAIARRY
jgi:hypothetical protein